MERPLLRPAVNATGVILHTGLGRAVLADAARKAVMDIAERYCTLEIDTETGKRGLRHDTVTALLCRLTGAESAVVVNNNAAAVMLLLHALACDRAVIVSRGQLVEIGGSFRMPDVMVQSGARLVSVGATNRTTVEDYRRAITSDTALLMMVHRSNFDIAGEDVSVLPSDLATLGREMGLPVVYDLGGGQMIDLSPYGLPAGPTVSESIRAGLDLVCFSGDKLLGGPQAGIIVGRKTLIDRMKKDPLMRAFRVDKMTFAALHATLELFLHPQTLSATHPVTAMISLSEEKLKRRATRLAGRLKKVLPSTWNIQVEPSTSEIGGGALPDRALPTFVVALYPPPDVSPHTTARAFREQTPAVFGRVGAGCLLLDVRTMGPDDSSIVEQAATCIGVAL